MGTSVIGIDFTSRCRSTSFSSFSINLTKLLCKGHHSAHGPVGLFLRKTQLAIPFATIKNPASDFVTDFPRSTHLVTGYELAFAHARPVGG
jgi:hypothetical protein